jgi:hypothetical protein
MKVTAILVAKRVLDSFAPDFAVLVPPGSSITFDSKKNVLSFDA